MSPHGAEVVRRPKAEPDLIEAVLWHRDNASPRAADDFVDAVENSLDVISRHPLAGSGEVGMRLRIPGLRSLPVRGTPYILYYLGQHQRIDVVRVLHGRRDIDAELTGA